MKKPYCMVEDKSHRTLQEFVELIALGIANDVADGEKIELIQSETTRRT